MPLNGTWGLRDVHSGTLCRDTTCSDGNGCEVYSKHIEFTDFPEPGIPLYDSDWVIYLSSEYGGRQSHDTATVWVG
jgi:hypothetical protein